MVSLIEACAAADFPAQISLVLSNTPQALGIETAQKAGIATAIVDHKAHDSREAFESEMLETLEAYDLDLICLAGFMRILTPRFIDSFDGDIINIHPSLLPAYKGLNTHARAIADGQSEAGCSVHYVTPALDDGEIIVQRRVPVLADDTPDTLAARVLIEEHVAYPEALKIAAEKIAA